MSEHFILNKYQKIIILISTLGFLLISVIISLIGIYPLYNELRKEEKKKLSFAVTTKLMAIEQFISRAKNITFQINSRTQIRKKLEAYNKKEINLKKLKLFCEPKLKDAMKLSEEVTGLTRLDKLGDPVISLGQKIPEKIIKFLFMHKKQAHLYGPIFIHNNPYVAVFSNIFNRKFEDVGADIILFDTLKLKQIVQDYSGLGKTGETILIASSKETFSSFFPLRTTKTKKHLMDVSLEKSLGSIFNLALKNKVLISEINFLNIKKINSDRHEN